jgi:hypothetical protein
MQTASNRHQDDQQGRKLHSVPTPPAGAPALRVDPILAREVADDFLSAPEAPHDLVVREAYRQLVIQSDRLFDQITKAGPGAIRVEFTRNAEPYASDRELIDAVRSSRLLEVTMASVERDRLHPIMNCEPGGAYDRYRAVHDVLGHVVPDAGFDRHGEYAAWLYQERYYRGPARQALATLIHGEHTVLWTTGVTVDHKAFLLDGGLLARARRTARRQGFPTEPLYLSSSPAWNSRKNSWGSALAA